MLQEKKKMILSFVEDKDYRPMRIKEMAVLFAVPKKKRGEFHEVIDELLKEGSIAIDRRGFICLPKEHMLTGTFMATTRGFGFVRVETEEDDIFISEKNLKQRKKQGSI